MSKAKSSERPSHRNGQTAERPRFFPRQMVTAADLTQLLDYLRERQRRHNRALHGWGVVHGAEVLPVYGENNTLKKVQVLPGFVLSPQGDEIQIAAPYELDPREAMISGAPDDPY